MTKIIQHTTIEGQRWDNIAIDFYGSLTIVIDGVKHSSISFLIEANPTVPIYDVFPTGVILDIPIIEQIEVLSESTRLPPWKQ